MLLQSDYTIGDGFERRMARILRTCVNFYKWIKVRLGFERFGYSSFERIGCTVTG